MASWDLGASIVKQTMTVKTEHWGKLPHVLCGLAHPDRAKASEAAMHCTEQWDKAPGAEFHHRLSTLFLGPDSTLRPFVRAMQTGETLMEQPPFSEPQC